MLIFCPAADWLHCNSDCITSPDQSLTRQICYIPFSPNQQSVRIKVQLDFLVKMTWVYQPAVLSLSWRKSMQTRSLLTCKPKTVPSLTDLYYMKHSMRYESFVDCLSHNESDRDLGEDYASQIRCIIFQILYSHQILSNGPSKTTTTTTTTTTKRAAGGHTVQNELLVTPVNHNWIKKVYKPQIFSHWSVVIKLAWYSTIHNNIQDLDK